jgi:tRNA pseudouridine38-40 synthase
VGEGRFDPSTLVSLSDALERTSAFKVMPAKGLTLAEVGYPPESEYDSRAQQTRARRA